jgi:hypothetical protein
LQRVHVVWVKPGFHMVVNCRERVVTVVRVVFETKMETWRKVLSQHAGNSSRQLQQCRRDRLEFYLDNRLKTCRDGYFLFNGNRKTTAWQQFVFLKLPPAACTIPGYKCMYHRILQKFTSSIIFCQRRKKKYLWFRFPTDPIFFCRPYYFFNAIDCATLFSPGGCGLLVQRAKMASACCHT